MFVNTITVNMIKKHSIFLSVNMQIKGSQFWKDQKNFFHIQDITKYLNAQGIFLFLPNLKANDESGTVSISQVKLLN